MNKQNIIALARNIFPDIQYVRDDLYRGELKISGKSAGIYYMDISGHVPFDKFNEYQENLLADEYYSLSGTLQWNLYLLLLQDDVNQQIKERVERNDKYARKYIFTEPQFEEFFKLEKSDAEVSSNVVLQWKEQLNKVDLQEVYSKAKYTEAVDRFLLNQTRKIEGTETLLDSLDNIKINFINQIILKPTYREYPREPRVFKFGKVNLIKGINGVGKTCVLESLELIACGRAFRNSDKIEPDNCVEAIINNSREIEICTPTNNTKYRLRDAYWYSNNYPRDNFVFSSFNRFNFFNTDASIDFAKSNIEDDVKKSLSNIILGSEFNYISERIDGFFDRIKPIYNELNRKIKEAEQKIKESDIIISKLGKSEIVRSLIDTINQTLHSLHFKNIYFDIEKDTAEVEVLINQVKTLTEKVSENQNNPIDSKNDLNNAISLFAIKDTALNNLKSDLELLSSQVSLKENEITKVTKVSSLLESSTKYFSEPKLFDIKGFSKRFSDNEELIRKLNVVKRGLNSIDLQTFSSEANINDLLDKTQIDLSDARLNLDICEADLKKLLAHFSNTDKIINEIKLLGKEYLALAPDAISCPLCQSSYEHSELQKRIEEILQTNSKENQERIDILHQKQQTAKENVENVTYFYNGLTSIKTLYENTFSKDSIEMSVSEIITEISQLINQEDFYIKKKQELVGFREMAESFNITEEEFLFLSNKLITDLSPEFTFVFDNKKLFEEKATQLSSEIKILKESLVKLQEDRYKLITNFKKTIGLDDDKTYTLQEFYSLMEREKKNIDLFDNYFSQISQLIDLKDENLLSEINLGLAMLQKNIVSLKIEKQNQYEYNQAKNEKQLSQTFLDNNIKNFERIKIAFNTLQTISQSDGTHHLNSFFESNLKEIVDIFKTIHAPREFKSLIFQDRQFYLINENDKKHKLTEISTGQRAALALSIFISLNRQLKNGPNLLIFDDPISHIDDLNALSFLDFLRFFILKENRQIFFATASSKLASLFEKKFEFLGNEEFKKWELNR
ncbi:MAG: hypothetical protein WC644_00220 [Ignavibacteria bacterium]